MPESADRSEPDQARSGPRAARRKVAARRRFGRVRKLPSGRWQARYKGPDGRDRAAPDTFKTKTAADTWLSQVETDMARGAWIDHQLGRQTVESWAERYMATTAHLKPKTRATYAGLLRSTIVPPRDKDKGTLRGLALGDVKQITVREWVAHLTGDRQLSPSRVRQSYRLLSQIMDAAVGSGLIVSNPCVGVKPPRLPDHEPTIVSRKQAATIGEAMPEPYRLLVELLAGTGVRIGEAYALRRSAVDTLNRRVIVRESLTDLGAQQVFTPPKNHQARTITIGRTLADRLSRHLAENVPPDDDALLFVNRAGNPIRHADFLRSTWRPTVERLHLDGVRPHDLRASHASWLVDEGFTVLDVAARLGHSFASVTTRHYARALEGRDADVAAFLDSEPGDDGSKAPVRRLPRARKATASESNGHAAGTSRTRATPAGRRTGTAPSQRRRSAGS